MFNSADHTLFLTVSEELMQKVDGKDKDEYTWLIAAGEGECRWFWLSRISYLTDKLVCSFAARLQV